jgi:hypothetical protein
VHASFRWPRMCILGAMIPRLLFVLGKGGVGRSTVAAALGAGLAERGRVLIVQWTVSDPISPWFGQPPAGYEARALAPNLFTMNFSAEAALEQYFVEHLHRRAFYRAVISNQHVRRATRAAPGFEELGTLMWLTTLAAEELGWSYDHVIVDLPAMGHGASLFAVPHTTSTLGFGGLLATECERVSAMLADPARSGVLIVTTPEELAVEEAVEFWPRITRELGRPPLAAIVNKSVRRLGSLPAEPSACSWFQALDVPSEEGRAGLERVYAHFVRRATRERSLVERLSSDRPVAVFPVDDALLLDEAPSAHQIIRRAMAALAPVWGAP